jgi:hypothetical protein
MHETENDNVILPLTILRNLLLGGGFHVCSNLMSLTNGLWTIPDTNWMNRIYYRIGVKAP